MNGRNWMQLTMLTPGSRTNTVGDSPTLATSAGSFQLNLDGQQVTQLIAQTGYGQPRFSRDAMAEFQFVTSRFDATQGRSSGAQVNAVTKSGTNTFAGTLSGYFRNDKFNAKDFIVKRVLPYSNQQISGTFGGPIVQNRAHFFGYYEGERNPQSFTFTSPYPAFNIAPLVGTNTQKLAGRARRLPVEAEHAPDGPRQRLERQTAVRSELLRRRDPPPVALLVSQPPERQRVCLADADARHARLQRDQGRVVAHRVRSGRHRAVHPADRPERLQHRADELHAAPALAEHAACAG